MGGLNFIDLITLLAKLVWRVCNVTLILLLLLC